MKDTPAALGAVTSNCLPRPTRRPLQVSGSFKLYKEE